MAPPKTPQRARPATSDAGSSRGSTASRLTRAQAATPRGPPSSVASGSPVSTAARIAAMTSTPRRSQGGFYARLQAAASASRATRATDATPAPRARTAPLSASRSVPCSPALPAASSHSSPADASPASHGSSDDSSTSSSSPEPARSSVESESASGAGDSSADEPMADIPLDSDGEFVPSIDDVDMGEDDDDEIMADADGSPAPSGSDASVEPRDESPEILASPCLHACMVCVRAATNRCSGAHPVWELACVRGAATRCVSCERGHRTCSEVPALLAGNVRDALGTMSRLVALDAQLGGDALVASSLLLTGGLFMKSVCQLLSQHQAQFGLKRLESRLYYAGVVYEGRAALERVLIAGGDDGSNPERRFLRLRPGDPLHQLWQDSVDEFLEDVRSLLAEQGLSAVRVLRWLRYLDPREE